MKMKRIPTSNQLDAVAVGTSLSSTAASVSSISTETFADIFSGSSNVTQRKGKGAVMNKGPLVSSSCTETMEAFTCTEQKNREKSRFFSFQNRAQLSFWNLFLKRKGNARQFIQASLLLAKMWIWISNCSDTNGTSNVFLFPALTSSILLLLLSAQTGLLNFQYSIAISQWLWTFYFQYTRGICVSVLPLEAFSFNRALLENSVLSICTILCIYLLRSSDDASP